MFKSKEQGYVKRMLVAFVACVFVASSVLAYTVSRKVDSSGTQIYLLEDSGNLTVAGAITSSSGSLTLTSGDLTLTSGDATLTSGDLTLTSGNATLTSGNLTLTSGNATLTSGDLTMTAGDVNITAGFFSEGIQDITVTNGEAITASAGYIAINSDTGVITNTLAASSAIPLYSHIYFHNDGTGSVVFLDSDAGFEGNGTEETLAAQDTMHVIKTATNVYTRFGGSDN
jgi:putative membrane protein